MKPAATKQSSGDYRYLPLTDQIFHSGIYVTSAGTDRVRPGQKYPPNVHPSLYHFSWEEGRTFPEFSINLVTRGTGEFESRETGTVRLRPGAVMLLFPDVWHRYRPGPRSGWTVKWVNFNGEVPHQLLSADILRADRAVLRPSDPALVEKTLDRLLDHIRAKEQPNSLLVSMKLFGVLSAVLEDALPPANSQSATEAVRDPLVAAALDTIWTRSHQVLEVPMIARALGVTRRTLERHFDRFHDKTVLEEIVGCRFNRATRLLRETHLPIKVVTSLAGFGSSENMRYVFRHRAELSPEEYRATFAAPERAAPVPRRKRRRSTRR